MQNSNEELKKSNQEIIKSNEEMKRSLKDLSKQMQDMKNSEDSTPCPLANFPPDQRAAYKNYLASIPHLEPAYLPPAPSMQAPVQAKIIEKTQDFPSPPNSPVSQSAPTPQGVMDIDQVNRKRIQQGSPTTPPITKKINANPHMQKDMARKLNFDPDSKSDKKLEEDPPGIPPVEGSAL